MTYPARRSLMVFPEIPNVHALAVLLLTLLALFLFTREKIPLDRD